MSVPTSSSIWRASLIFPSYDRISDQHIYRWRHQTISWRHRYAELLTAAPSVDGGTLVSGLLRTDRLPGGLPLAGPWSRSVGDGRSRSRSLVLMVSGPEWLVIIVSSADQTWFLMVDARCLSSPWLSPGLFISNYWDFAITFVLPTLTYAVCTTLFPEPTILSYSPLLCCKNFITSLSSPSSFLSLIPFLAFLLRFISPPCLFSLSSSAIILLLSSFLLFDAHHSSSLLSPSLSSPLTYYASSQSLDMSLCPHGASFLV